MFNPSTLSDTDREILLQSLAHMCRHHVGHSDSDPEMQSIIKRTRELFNLVPLPAQWAEADRNEVYLPDYAL